MTAINFTPELIAGIVGAALAWIFGWFPSLRTWYAALKPEIKSAIMLACLAVASVIIYLLALFDVIVMEAPITIWRLLTVFFVASSLSQSTYMLTPVNRDVKNIKVVKTINDIREVKPDAIVVEVVVPELQTVTLNTLDAKSEPQTAESATQPKLDLEEPELKVELPK